MTIIQIFRPIRANFAFPKGHDQEMTFLDKLNLNLIKILNYTHS
jgi:hypothetical protein